MSPWWRFSTISVVLNHEVEIDNVLTSVVVTECLVLTAFFERERAEVHLRPTAQLLKRSRVECPQSLPKGKGSNLKTRGLVGLVIEVCKQARCHMNTRRSSEPRCLGEEQSEQEGE